MATSHTSSPLRSAVANGVDAAAGSRPAELHPDAVIWNDLRPFLPKEFFHRSPSRLIYLAVALAAVIAHLLVVRMALNGQLMSAWALLTFAGAVYTYPYFFLVMHELQHGAVLPSGTACELASWAAGFGLPFQPRFWRALHLHHHAQGNQHSDTHRMRTVDEIGFVSRFLDFHFSNAFSYFSTAFAVQVVYCYSLWRFLNGTIHYHVTRTRVLVDLLIHIALGVALIAMIGPRLTLLGLVPVYAVGNVFLNVYMISQHLTRPMVERPASLRTSVSVWLWRGYSHMDVGRHAEHHLYPSVAANKLRVVSALLRARHTGAFREKSLAAALLELFSLPGHYYEADVLTDRQGAHYRRID